VIDEFNLFTTKHFYALAVTDNIGVNKIMLKKQLVKAAHSKQTAQIRQRPYCEDDSDISHQNCISPDDQFKGSQSYRLTIKFAKFIVRRYTIFYKL